MKRENGLSIIIITYNRGDELKETFKLLMDYEFPCPMEIVVIDQNSTDDTKNICEYFSERFKCFKIHHMNENLGVAGGRNFGLSKAAYEYVVFLDDDANFVGKNSFKQIYDLMNEKKEFDLFAFQVKNLEGDNYNWPYGEKKKKIANEVFECKFFIGCAHAMRASWFESVGGYSNQLFFWGEETELVMKTVANGGRGVYYDGRIIALHRVHGNGRVMDEDRFYYQVRNRNFLIKELYPNGFKFVFYFCYFLRYLEKALKHGWLNMLKKGIHDSKGMACQPDCTLTLKQYITYFKL